MIAQTQDFVTIHPELLERALKARATKYLGLAMYMMRLSNNTGNLMLNDTRVADICRFFGIKERSLKTWIEKAMKVGYIHRGRKAGQYVIRSFTRNGGRLKTRVRTDYNYRVHESFFKQMKSYYFSMRVVLLQYDNYIAHARKTKTQVLVTKRDFCKSPGYFTQLVCQSSKSPEYDLNTGERYLPASVSRTLISKMLGISVSTAKVWKRKAVALGLMTVESQIVKRKFSTSEEANQALETYSAAAPKHAKRFYTAGHYFCIQNTDLIHVNRRFNLVHEEMLKSEKMGLVTWHNGEFLFNG